MLDRTILVFLRNILSSWLSRVAGMALSFIVTPLLVHGLGKEEYGLWAVAGTLTAYLALLDVGVIGGLVRAISVANAQKEYRRIGNYVSTAFAFYLAIGLALLLGVYLTQDWIARHLGVPPHLIGSTAYVLVGVTAIMVIANLTAVFTQVFTALERIDLTGVVTFLISLSSAIGFVAALFVFHSGIEGVITSNIIATAVVLVISGLWARRECSAVSINPRLISREGFREIISVSIAIQLSNIAATVNISIDKLVLAGFVGLTAAGLYDVASRLSLVIFMLCWLVASAAYPVMSRLSEEPLSSVRVFYLRAERYLQVSACGLTGGLIVIAPWLVPLWLGPGFGRVVVSTQVLAIATAGLGFTQVAKVTLWGLKRLREMYIFESWRLGVHIGSSLLLTWRFGYNGALAGAAFSITLPSLWLVWVAHRHIGISNREWVRRTLSGPVAAGALAGIGSWLITAQLAAPMLPAGNRFSDLLLTVFGGTLFLGLYFLLLKQLGVLADDDLATLRYGRTLLWGRLRGMVGASG